MTDSRNQFQVWTAGFEPFEWTEQDHENLKQAIKKVKRMRDDGVTSIEQDCGLEPDTIASN